MALSGGSTVYFYTLDNLKFAGDDGNGLLNREIGVQGFTPIPDIRDGS